MPVESDIAYIGQECSRVDLYLLWCEGVGSNGAAADLSKIVVPPPAPRSTVVETGAGVRRTDCDAGRRSREPDHPDWQGASQPGRQPRMRLVAVTDRAIVIISPTPGCPGAVD